MKNSVTFHGVISILTYGQITAVFYRFNGSYLFQHRFCLIVVYMTIILLYIFSVLTTAGVIVVWKDVEPLAILHFNIVDIFWDFVVVVVCVIIKTSPGIVKFICGLRKRPNLTKIVHRSSPFFIGFILGCVIQYLFIDFHITCTTRCYISWVMCGFNVERSCCCLPLGFHARQARLFFFFQLFRCSAAATQVCRPPVLSIAHNVCLVWGKYIWKEIHEIVLPSLDLWAYASHLFQRSSFILIF